MVSGGIFMFTPRSCWLMTPGRQSAHATCTPVPCTVTEMNASFWDRAVVRGFRCALLDEHLGLDTTHLDLQSALHVYREIAKGNRLGRDAGQHHWQGLAYR